MTRRRYGSHAWPALGALGVLAACGPQRVPEVARVDELGLPAQAGSGQVQLSAAGAERVLASWLEPQGDASHALRFAVLDERGWSPPRTVVAGDDLFVNFADFPSVIALRDGTLWAHWLHERGPRGAYDVRLSSSRDGGDTWSAPLTPHRDATLAEHGFVSLFPWSDGRLALVWLDGRKWAAAMAPGAAGGHAGAGETQLMHALVDGSGALGAETVLDERVCDCCQTAAVSTPRGALVAFRDRGPDEVRDIAFVRSGAPGWTAPRAVAADGWRIAGCPVNGPALASDGEHAALAWYTSASTPRVSVAFSSDAGTTFGAPVVVDDGRPIGRVDVVVLEGGDALVSWLEQAERGAELRLRRVTPGGARTEARRVADLSAARSSGFPRLERSGNAVVLAWRDAAEPPRLHSARVVP